jgi:hypothetical protein
MAGPPGTLTVSPNGDLVDFQRVDLSGVGLEPGLQEWYQCRGEPTDASDCDGYNSDFIYVQGDGTVTEEIYVDARIFLPDGSEVDCRTDPAGCVIGVGFLEDAGDWPTVALAFDPEAPLRPVVVATVEPSTDLEDDQVVTVRAQHLSFREDMYAYLCADDDGPPGTRCDIERMVQTVPDADGSITVDLEVRSTFEPPLGGSVDCTADGTTCHVFVAWGFYPPVDRRTEVPVSFAQAPPPVPPPPAPAPVEDPTEPAELPRTGGAVLALAAAGSLLASAGIALQRAARRQLTRR